MEQVQWLDEREARAWRAFQLMHMQLDGELARRLAAATPLSYQDYEVLVVLTEYDDQPVRQFEIGRVLRWEKSRVSHHIKRMERRGLVEKQDCETDRRGAFVAITEAGRRAIEDAAPGHVADVRELFIDQLSTEELATLTEIAERVSSRLDVGTWCE